MNAAQHLNKHEYNTMVSQYEADQNNQMFNAVVESQLRIEYQQKVNKMDAQLHQRDAEILALSRRKESISQMLTETTYQLLSKGAALL